MPPNTNLHTYTLTHLHTKKSQALFFALFLLAVVGTLSGTLAFMWHTEIGVRASSRDGLIAFYLAQAGIEEAKIWARNNIVFSSPFNSAWKNLGGGRYNYTAAITSGPGRMLNSVGQTLDASGAVISEKQITAGFSDITNMPFPIKNPGSWREI